MLGLSLNNNYTNAERDIQRRKYKIVKGIQIYKVKKIISWKVSIPSEKFRRKVG